MTSVTKRLLWAAMAAVLMVPVWAGAASAQEMPQQAPQQQPAPEAPDQDELESFAEAVLDVREIQDDIQEALAAVQDPEQATELQQQASVQMEAALREHDLTVERYSEIAAALEADPQLNAEFQEILAEATEEREG